MICKNCKYFFQHVTEDFDGFCLDQNQGERNSHYCVNFERKKTMNLVFQIARLVVMFLEFLETKEPERKP